MTPEQLDHYRAMKQWVASRLKHRILKDAEANDNYEKTYLYVYELESIADFNRLLGWCPKKNTLIFESDPYGGNDYVFVVDSCSISKRSPMAGGRIQLEVTLKLRLVSNLAQQIANPGALPPFNFRMSSATNEESTTIFYPGNSVEKGVDVDYDEIWEDELFKGEGNDVTGNVDSPKPFVNTAGIMLEGTASFPTTQMSFSYCVDKVDFELMSNFSEAGDGGWFWALPGTINCDSVVIAGFQFAPRTLKIESLSAEYSVVQKTGVESGEVVDKEFEYYRIDATFNINPRTWNQRFLNVGTHVNRNGVIMRIWNWSDPATGLPTWGTYSDYRRAGGVNGEAVTEPLALNHDGDGVMGLDANGRMNMTYRVGSLYRPINFSYLAFPSAPPTKLSFG